MNKNILSILITSSALLGTSAAMAQSATSATEGQMPAPTAALPATLPASTPSVPLEGDKKEVPAKKVKAKTGTAHKATKNHTPVDTRHKVLPQANPESSDATQ